MDIRQTFENNLKHYRSKANMSQASLAVRTGVDRAHVSAMERGQQNVTIITLWHVAQALDVEPAALPENRDAPDYARLTQHLSQDLIIR